MDGEPINGHSPGEPPPERPDAAAVYLKFSRVSGEPRKAREALRIFVLLGPGRSLEALLAQAGQTMRSLATLENWANRYDWWERAQGFDELEQARRRQSMQSGLALPDERVEELKGLYSGLRGYFREALPFWKADLAVGGEAQSNHRASHFNTGIVSQMRGVLDDLARETGGRALRISPAESGPGAGSCPPPDLNLLNEEELAEFRRLLDKATPSGLPARPRQLPLPGLPLPGLPEAPQHAGHG